jgi:hypothetical protein
MNIKYHKSNIESISSVAFGIILAAFSIFVAIDTILARFFSRDARVNTRQNQLSTKSGVKAHPTLINKLTVRSSLSDNGRFFSLGVFKDLSYFFS